MLHGGRQGELKSVSARRCFAARLHYNGDTCDRLSPVPLCIFSTSEGRCAFNRRRMFLCFFFFHDGEVVMEDGLGDFFFLFCLGFSSVRSKMNRMKNTWGKEKDKKKNERIL